VGRGRRCPAGLILWRSALRADFTALLGPGSRRITRCIHFVHFAQTDAASQMFRCALRAPTPATALLVATEIAPPGTACRSGTTEPCPHRMPGWCRKGAFGSAAARRSEAPRSAGLMAARAARFVRLTRRSCVSAESEANEASSATGHETEPRRGAGAQHRPPQSSAAAGPDAPLVHQRWQAK
jgi:hypothetical protein